MMTTTTFAIAPRNRKKKKRVLRKRMPGPTMKIVGGASLSSGISIDDLIERACRKAMKKREKK